MKFYTFNTFLDYEFNYIFLFSIPVIIKNMNFHIKYSLTDKQIDPQVDVWIINYVTKIVSQ